VGIAFDGSEVVSRSSLPDGDMAIGRRDDKNVAPVSLMNVEHQVDSRRLSTYKTSISTQGFTCVKR
jgi:hypothetical protein